MFSKIILVVGLMVFCFKVNASERPLCTDSEDLNDQDQIICDEAVEDCTNVNYNRWRCSATGEDRRTHRTYEYFGLSEWFAAGSGRGQEAKKEALRKAIEKCHQHLRFDCRGELSDCTRQTRVHEE